MNSSKNRLKQQQPYFCHETSRSCDNIYFVLETHSNQILSLGCGFDIRR